MSLKEKLLKNSTIDLTATILDSTVFERDIIPTDVPMINVALYGSVDGGITPGITQLAGPSRHYKTGFALLFASAFLKKYPDGIILFYDSEFGSPQSYFDQYNIPLGSVIHTPITNIEELRHDIANQLQNLDKTDKVFIIIDSVGGLASKKESDDAISGNEAADMTRAKVLKSLFRIITPKLMIKGIPLVVINHTYQTMEFISKTVVSGGQGATLAPDNIWILGRQQDKDGKELTGYNFVINVEKSRHVQEKSKILINSSFKTGINKWSGLLENAIEGGFIVKTPAGKKGNKYNIVNPTTGEIGEDIYGDIELNDNIWETLLKNKSFTDFLKNKYSLVSE